MQELDESKPTKTFFQKNIHTWRFPLRLFAGFIGMIFAFFSILVAKNSYSAATRAFKPLAAFSSTPLVEISVWVIAISVAVAILVQPAYALFNYINQLGDAIDKGIATIKGKNFFLDEAEDLLKEIQKDMDNVSKHNIAIEQDIVHSLSEVIITTPELFPLRDKIWKNIERLDILSKRFKTVNQVMISDVAVSFEDKRRESKAENMFNALSKDTLFQYRAIQEQLKILIDEDIRRQKFKSLLLIDKTFEKRTKEKEKEDKVLENNDKPDMLQTLEKPGSLITNYRNNFLNTSKINMNEQEMNDLDFTSKTDNTHQTVDVNKLDAPNLSTV